MVQHNKESADEFLVRFDRVWERIDQMGYSNTNNLKTVMLQRGFLDEAYKNKKCIERLDEKFIHGDLALTKFKTPSSFTKHMTSLFTNVDIYENG